jgi:hypothetical protein
MVNDEFSTYNLIKQMATTVLWIKHVFPGNFRGWRGRGK